MLSTAAWNAFLKTLEEPPPNTVFVLATTEANKVPATVVDRCHRFDFHRPTVEQIAAVVRRAAEAESIEIPPRAVAALARSATGSFRDALGTLEQIVTYSGQPDRARRRAGGARSRRRRACSSRPSTPSPAATPRARSGRSTSAPGRGATRPRSPPTSRCVRASCCSCRRSASCRRSCRSPPRPTTPCARRPRACSTPSSCACSSCSARRWRPRVPAPTPARASSSRS